MKKKKKIFVTLTVVCSILFIMYIYIFRKKEFGLIIDKFGLTNNNYAINIDNNISRLVYVYWTSDNGFLESDNNKMLIYHHRHLLNDIPPFYGKNKFSIKYKNINYEKMGIFKYYSFSKYDYDLDIKLKEDNLIIKWKISNWYDPDIECGCDTIKIN